MILLYFFLIYVDDIIITSSSTSAISKLIADLNAKFAITNLDPMHYFLSFEAHWKTDGLYHSHQRYINDLLN